MYAYEPLVCFVALHVPRQVAGTREPLPALVAPIRPLRMIGAHVHSQVPGVASHVHSEVVGLGERFAARLADMRPLTLLLGEHLLGP